VSPIQRVIPLLCAGLFVLWVVELATPGLSWGYKLPAEAFLPLIIALLLWTLRDLPRERNGSRSTERAGELGEDR
jgi:uncharacterized membrane protein